jgi:hypothetical protein
LCSVLDDVAVSCAVVSKLYFSYGITPATRCCKSVTFTDTSRKFSPPSIPLSLSLSPPSLSVPQKNKLILVHGTMLSAIDNSTVPITVASLLDHMDWMTDRMINEELTHLIKKMDPVRGKIFWRTFADDVHSAPLNW